ncbi:MAG: cytochrome c biogenesis protein CcdA [Firmicutes bacterium]|nr:cytochrome c biogenesis protein CcdA [Bacillota bacterium]
MIQYTSFGIAFGAGLASVLSPCVVPLVPSYLTAMAGTPLTVDAVQDRTVRARVLTNALIFIAGFSLVLILSGLVATAIGQFIRHYQTLISELGGVVMVIFGLELAGIIHLGLLKRDVHLTMPKRGRLGVWSPLIMGIVFAAGWTPCVGPIWSSILILASRSHTVVLGGVLLATYAMGLALPFFILALFLSRATLWTRQLNRYLPWIERVAGGLLTVLGLLLATHLYVRLAGLV